MSDRRQYKKIDTRIGKANAVLHELYRSVVTKWEHSNTAKLAVFKSIFAPFFTYSHESWTLIERIPYQVQATEMEWLRSVHGGKVLSCEIRKTLNVETLLRIERSQLRWCGYLTRMFQGRMARRVLLTTPTGKRPRRRPRTRWGNYISDLGPVLVWSQQNYQEIAEDSEVFR